MLNKNFAALIGILVVLLILLNLMRRMEIENNELKSQLHQVQTEAQFMRDVSNKLDAALLEWDHAHKDLLQHQSITTRKLEQFIEESDAFKNWSSVVVPDFDLDSLLKDSIRAGQSACSDVAAGANTVE